MRLRLSNHRKGCFPGLLAPLLCPRKPRHQELLSRHPGQSHHLHLCLSARAGRWQRQRVRLLLNRRNPLHIPLGLLQPRPTLLHQLIALTLTQLAVLGCSRQQTFLQTARLVRCHNPLPSEDVLFCPDGALPAFVTSIPALSSGPELWHAVHNHRPEPLQLHAAQSIGVLEVVHLAETPTSAPPSSTHPSSPCQPPLPECLSTLQQQQLNELFKEFQDVFSQGDDEPG